MKSIRTKFLVLMIACVLLSAITLVGVGIVNAGALAEEDSIQIMNSMCAERAGELDTMLLSAEQAVDTMQRYAQEQMFTISDTSTQQIYTMLYMKKTRELAYNVAENTSGTTSVYMCLDPLYATSSKGFLLLRRDGEDTFEEGKAVSLKEYQERDGEDADWYQAVVTEDTDYWYAPHSSIADGQKVVSYIVPLHKGNEVIGIIGMDISMNRFTDYIDTIQIYDTGYAFLADAERNIYYHKEYPDGVREKNVHGTMRRILGFLDDEEGGKLFDYKWNGEKKKLAFHSLRNGMSLVVTAPTKEINAARSKLMEQSMAFLAVVIVVTTLLTIQMTKKITQPLKELTSAAKMVADGDLTVDIDCTSNDEVGMLARSFEQTVHSLKKHIDYINELAYTDAMTGTMNKIAYKDVVSEMEDQIESGNASFAVVVMDINNLKKMNDNFGHEFGDMLIRDSASIIKNTFKNSTIYRIGGDEFATLLNEEDSKRWEEFLEIFSDEMNRFNKNNTKYEQKVEIAIGIANYRPKEDKNFLMVFRRADQKMYENKLKLKQHEKEMAAAGAAEEQRRNEEETYGD